MALKCSTCAYDRNGLPDGRRCPECGEPPGSRPSARPPLGLGGLLFVPLVSCAGFMQANFVGYFGGALFWTFGTIGLCLILGIGYSVALALWFDSKRRAALFDQGAGPGNRGLRIACWSVALLTLEVLAFVGGAWCARQTLDWLKGIGWWVPPPGLT